MPAGSIAKAPAPVPKHQQKRPVFYYGKGAKSKPIDASQPDTERNKRLKLDDAHEKPSKSGGKGQSLSHWYCPSCFIFHSPDKLHCRKCGLSRDSGVSDASELGSADNSAGLEPNHGMEDEPSDLLPEVSQNDVDAADEFSEVELEQEDTEAAPSTAPALAKVLSRPQRVGGLGASSANDDSAEVGSFSAATRFVARRNKAAPSQARSPLAPWSSSSPASSSSSAMPQGRRNGMKGKDDAALQEAHLRATPSAENPVSYKVIHSLGALVRQGMDTTSKQVGQLTMGSVATIVEVRSRRARIVTPIEGWVSIQTQDGVVILRQCDEISDDMSSIGRPEGDQEDKGGLTGEHEASTNDNFTRPLPKLPGFGARRPMLRIPAPRRQFAADTELEVAGEDSTTPNLNGNRKGEGKSKSKGNEEPMEDVAENAIPPDETGKSNQKGQGKNKESLEKRKQELQAMQAALAKRAREGDAEEIKTDERGKGKSEGKIDEVDEKGKGKAKSKTDRKGPSLAAEQPSFKVSKDAATIDAKGKGKPKGKTERTGPTLAEEQPPDEAVEDSGNLDTNGKGKPKGKVERKGSPFAEERQSDQAAEDVRSIDAKGKGKPKGKINGKGLKIAEEQPSGEAAQDGAMVAKSKGKPKGKAEMNGLSFAEEQPPDEAASIFIALLEKQSPKDRLGLNVDYLEGQALVVNRVIEGMAKVYNATVDPKMQIKPGDHIIDVNGIRGNLDEMVGAISESPKLTIVVERRSNEATASDPVSLERKGKGKSKAKGKGKEPPPSIDQPSPEATSPESMGKAETKGKGKEPPPYAKALFAEARPPPSLAKGVGKVEDEGHRKEIAAAVEEENSLAVDEEPSRAPIERLRNVVRDTRPAWMKKMENGEEARQRLAQAEARSQRLAEAEAEAEADQAEQQMGTESEDKDVAMDISAEVEPVIAEPSSTGFVTSEALEAATPKLPPVQEQLRPKPAPPRKSLPIPIHGVKEEEDVERNERYRPDMPPPPRLDIPPPPAPPPKRMRHESSTEGVGMSVAYAGTGKPGTLLYVSNLARETTEAVLKGNFGGAGISVVKVKLNPDNAHHGKRTAMIQVDNLEEAAAAIQMFHGTPLDPAVSDTTEGVTEMSDKCDNVPNNMERADPGHNVDHRSQEETSWQAGWSDDRWRDDRGWRNEDWKSYNWERKDDSWRERDRDTSWRERDQDNSWRERDQAWDADTQDHERRASQRVENGDSNIAEDVWEADLQDHERIDGRQSEGDDENVWDGDLQDHERQEGGDEIENVYLDSQEASPLSSMEPEIRNDEAAIMPGAPLLDLDIPAAPGTLLLAGFPVTWGVQQIKPMFTFFGFDGISIVKDPRTGAHVAMVKLKKPEKAEKVVAQVHGTEVDTDDGGQCTLSCELFVGGNKEESTQEGRHLFYIDELAMPNRPDIDALSSDVEVFIENLPFHAYSVEQIREWLEQYGPVDDISFICHLQTRELSGNGYVRFSSHETAASFITSQDILDEHMRIAWSESERLLQGESSNYEARIDSIFEDVISSFAARDLWMLSESSPAYSWAPARDGKQLHFIVCCSDDDCVALRNALTEALATFHGDVSKRRLKAAGNVIPRRAVDVPGFAPIPVKVESQPQAQVDCQPNVASFPAQLSVASQPHTSSPSAPSPPLKAPPPSAPQTQREQGRVTAPWKNPVGTRAAAASSSNEAGHAGGDVAVPLPFSLRNPDLQRKLEEGEIAVREGHKYRDAGQLDRAYQLYYNGISKLKALGKQIKEQEGEVVSSMVFKRVEGYVAEAKRVKAQLESGRNATNIGANPAAQATPAATQSAAGDGVDMQAIDRYIQNVEASLESGKQVGIDNDYEQGNNALKQFIDEFTKLPQDHPAKMEMNQKISTLHAKLGVLRERVEKNRVEKNTAACSVMEQRANTSEYSSAPQGPAVVPPPPEAAAEWHAQVMQQPTHQGMASGNTMDWRPQLQQEQQQQGPPISSVPPVMAIQQQTMFPGHAAPWQNSFVPDQGCGFGMGAQHGGIVAGSAAGWQPQVAQQQLQPGVAYEQQLQQQAFFLQSGGQLAIAKSFRTTQQHVVTPFVGGALPPPPPPPLW